MKFRTEINIEPFTRKIAHQTPVFSIGSCFADTIAAKLERYKFRVTGNPFGVLYNPLSIAAALEALDKGRRYTETDLAESDGVWFSYAHHGSFSAATPEAALAVMNGSAESASEALREADTVIITFGTAWVYELDGVVVANCHKQPASLFTRRRLSVSEIVERWSALMETVLKDKNVIFTVSPVRHLKDGFEENSLSKSLLRVAVGELVGIYPSARYFPAFEIVTDDLRDYRFYKGDMVHPSDEAVEYVWEKFSGAAFSDDTLALLPRIEAIRRAMDHRPFSVGSEPHRKFREASLRQAQALQRENPGVDFSAEIEFFRER